MRRLSKAEIKLHNQACEILEKEVLSFEEKEFVLRNWNEGAENEITAYGAFFTPFDLAADFSIEVPNYYKRPTTVIDLCAGIGALAFWAYHRQSPEHRPEITCVENNFRYVEIGKKILPEATWICADVFEFAQTNEKEFDCAISNPPFGNIKKENFKGAYTGNKFEYALIETALNMAEYGAFILPQNSAGFRYSGAHYFDRTPNNAYKKFIKQTSIYMDAGCGIDTSIYKNVWKNTNIITEIVCCEKEEHDDFKQETYSVKNHSNECEQLSLFSAA